MALYIERFLLSKIVYDSDDSIPTYRICFTCTEIKFDKEQFIPLQWWSLPMAVAFVRREMIITLPNDWLKFVENHSLWF